jgi:hypothetical protein
VWNRRIRWLISKVKWLGREGTRDFEWCDKSSGNRIMCVYVSLRMGTIPLCILGPHMHMVFPICKGNHREITKFYVYRQEMLKNSHMGSPSTHNEIVRIRGLTYILPIFPIKNYQNARWLFFDYFPYKKLFRLISLLVRVHIGPLFVVEPKKY